LASEPPCFDHGKFTTPGSVVLARAGEASHPGPALPTAPRHAVIEFLERLQILPPGIRYGK